MSERDRPDLLFVPGLLCDEAVWRQQIDALEGTARCSVADVSTGDSVAAIARSILREAAPRFALAGISMGGYVALEMMRQAPERITRLALIDTQPRKDTPEQADRRRQVIDTASNGGFDEVVASFPPLLFHPDRLAEGSLVEEFSAMAHRVGCATFLRQQTAIIGRPDSVATLPGISCPTLVVCGRQDLITPLENSELMAAEIPGARLVVLEECGHMSTMEHPDLVNELLENWLTADG